MSGDCINEINQMHALSHWADVYYNDVLVNFSDGNRTFGQPGVTLPSREYDLHYVRNNPIVFADLPSPKIALAYPYNGEVYKRADAITTFSSCWANAIENRSNERRFRDFMDFPASNWASPNKVINAKQTLGERFLNPVEQKDIYKFKLRFGINHFNIGYFGRVDEVSYPHVFCEGWASIKSVQENAQMIFAGNVTYNHLKEDFRIINKIPNHKMSQAYAALDLVIGNEQEAGEYAGSIKPLEAAAAGVPVLMRRLTARVEQLGSDYPLYYEETEEAVEKTKKYIQDHDFRQRCHNAIKNVAEQYSPKAIGSYLENEFKPFLK